MRSYFLGGALQTELQQLAVVDTAVTTVTDPYSLHNYQLSFTYDPSGRQKTRSGTFPSCTPTCVQTYFYIKAGCSTARRTPAGRCAACSSSRTTRKARLLTRTSNDTATADEFHYDAGGRLTHRGITGNGGGTDRTVYQDSLEYDQAGRVTRAMISSPLADLNGGAIQVYNGLGALGATSACGTPRARSTVPDRRLRKRAHAHAVERAEQVTNSYMDDGDRLTSSPGARPASRPSATRKTEDAAGGTPVGALGGHDGHADYDAEGNESCVSRATGQDFPSALACRAALGLCHQRARVDVGTRLRRRGPAARDHRVSSITRGSARFHRAAVRCAPPPRVDADAARHRLPSRCRRSPRACPRGAHGVGRRAGVRRLRNASLVARVDTGVTCPDGTAMENCPSNSPGPTRYLQDSTQYGRAEFTGGAMAGAVRYTFATGLDDPLALWKTDPASGSFGIVPHRSWRGLSEAGSWIGSTPQNVTWPQRQWGCVPRAGCAAHADRAEPLAGEPGRREAGRVGVDVHAEPVLRSKARGVHGQRPHRPRRRHQSLRIRGRGILSTTQGSTWSLWREGREAMSDRGRTETADGRTP